ncbi:MAG: cytochrome-c peroxidase [Phycisphaerae bacterium]
MVKRMSRGRARLVVAMGVSVAGVAIAQPPPIPPLPPVPVPPANPITEPKRILGKILFWDEQLSSDNTVSCGTCHLPGLAGSDPRIGRNPGPDNTLNTPDDKLGSPGVAKMDISEEYVEDPIFGFAAQVTRRNAQSVVGSGFSNNAMFWDGRAAGQFVDPETGSTEINNGGALESQAIGPILSSIEMGHDGRTWPQVREKLTAARPLAHARRIPPDMRNAISGGKTYADLFADAFGDSEITATRIAFAIATYERTLIPNQAPIDAFIAGNAAALTPAQTQGLNIFLGPQAHCNVCHTPPVFSNHTFRNIGLRPPVEDTGRQEVTNQPGDLGRFKTPTLRNVGLKNRFMHNGQLQTLTAVVNFYATPGNNFPQNRDPAAANIVIPLNARPALVDFLTNALTDPRVRNEVFPFDRPLLRSEGEACPSDIDGNGVTALNDLSILLAHFGVASEAAYFEGDVDGDGDIDLSDLSILLGGFGQPCS